ncbi:hypothetical protein D9615_008921 [Tricholomella constricta]|uniref:Chromatin elongation factor SPT5 n=1 Tax=Tricholomella constricta TaxID=117010 RepID=A0A8H5H0P6_9AGAR|nr:hypothetical protein D9615_008921 [Tricholomella constricta]
MERALVNIVFFPVLPPSYLPLCSSSLGLCSSSLGPLLVVSWPPAHRRLPLPAARRRPSCPSPSLPIVLSLPLPIALPARVRHDHVARRPLCPFPSLPIALPARSPPCPSPSLPVPLPAHRPPSLRIALPAHRPPSLRIALPRAHRPHSLPIALPRARRPPSCPSSLMPVPFPAHRPPSCPSPSLMPVPLPAHRPPSCLSPSLLISISMLLVASSPSLPITLGQSLFKANVQTSRNNLKRPRLERISAQQFLDIEATVDVGNETDDDEDDSDLEFIDEGESTAADRSTSHRRLFQEYQRIVETSDDWDELLLRARERAQHDRIPVPAQPTDDERPFAENARLWRVAVKPGCEETIVPILMEKVFRSAGQYLSVASIVGRASRPGWIVVEATQLSDVRELCQGVSNIFPQRVHFVEPSDAPAWLQETPAFTPRSQSWIRLTKYPYKGDLAYVQHFGEMWPGQARILVVPRLKLQPPSSVSAGKRKRTGRPPQALFDANFVRSIYGDGSVETRNQVFVFKGQVYQDGYLQTDTDLFYPQEATPTPAELDRFQRAQEILKGFLEHSLEVAAAKRLRIGDHVKVTTGQAQGSLGTIESISGNEASLILRNGSLRLSVALDALRKDLSIGDEIIVRDGPKAGTVGWVIAVSGEGLVIYDREHAQEMVVAAHCVDFFEADFVRASGSKTIAQKLKFKRDPHLHLYGKHVRVIRGSRWKDYVGIVKSGLDDDHVLVEFEATMRKERIPVSQLSLRSDAELRALQGPTLPVVLLPSSSTRQPLNAPSRAVPPTPIPPPSTVELSPAWNPSSQTPNPYTAFPYNPWIENPVLAGKRIKMIVKDTRPIIGNPGWENGDFEGRLGIWAGVEGGLVKLTTIQSTLLVPDKYVRPLRPTVKNQAAVVLEDGSITGVEYHIISLDGDRCIVRPRNARNEPKNRLDVDISSLAVIA